MVLKQWVFNYESYADGGLLFDSIVAKSARLAMKADPNAKAALARLLRRAPRERDMSRVLFKIAAGKSFEDPGHVDHAPDSLAAM